MNNHNGSGRPPEEEGDAVSRPVDPQPLAPVLPTERIEAVDTLRGFAVLGILMINIWFFALPEQVMYSPAAAGGSDALNLGVWAVVSSLFQQKFMALFSMLFGAGVILMYDRIEATNRPFKSIYYRRILWLLAIGLVHAYLIWWGDILFSYAVCGLLLYLFRRISARKLIIIGALVILVPIPLFLGMGAGISYIRDTARQAEQKLDEGAALTDKEKTMRDIWADVGQQFDPPPHMIEEAIEKRRSGFLTVSAVRAVQSITNQTFVLFAYTLWRAGGLMLIGMGLLRRRVLTGERSHRFYLIQMLAGFGIGLPIVIYGSSYLWSTGFSPIAGLYVMGGIDYVGSVFLTLGYIGLVMLAVQSGWLTGLQRRLAAVGRMALSNYLFHSVVFTLVFNGYGLGLFGYFNRFALLGFVFAMWVFQLYVSPVWLRHYRFGPAEWLWRSLTYRSRQPMRRTPPAPAG